MRNALYPLLAVVGLILVAACGSQFAPGRFFISLVSPYLALVIFLAGFCWRVWRWALTPVPFCIPVTCGQQRSLPWIKPARIDNPSGLWEVLERMGCELLIFRSLFRNNIAHLRKGRLSFGEDKLPWVAALIFHWALLVIFLRHTRLAFEYVPPLINALERLDGFFQLATPPIYVSDVALVCALCYLLARRFGNGFVRYISLFTDYFALLLLLGLAASGMLMRYATRIDILSVKQFALSLAAFRPVVPQGLGGLFSVHLFLVCTLAVYLPFSKLMHAGGVFLSPTRNMANSSRSKRHVNPWNAPVKTHSYGEWEEEFRDKIKAAGIPLESDHA